MTRADVIVVLSGSAVYKERTRVAAQLFQEGRSQKVLVTNDNLRGSWSSLQQRNPFFYERSLDELAAAGLTNSNNAVAVLTTPVDGTYDEAVVVRRYTEEQGLHSVLVVTSAYHSRRALWTFRRVFKDSGIDIGLVAVKPGIETPRPLTWWLTVQGWKLIPLEYVKMLYYAVHYH